MEQKEIAGNRSPKLIRSEFLQSGHFADFSLMSSTANGKPEVPIYGQRWTSQLMSGFGNLFIF